MELLLLTRDVSQLLLLRGLPVAVPTADHY
jgi:hypothetical protein